MNRRSWACVIAPSCSRCTTRRSGGAKRRVSPGAISAGTPASWCSGTRRRPTATKCRSGPETTEAIDQYLAALDARLPGAPPGRRDPVFVSLSKRSFGKRLSPSAILEVVKKRAREAGIRRNIVAHSLRHAAVTHALDHHASLEETGAHARHRDPRTTARYDRRRKRRGAAAADALPHLAV